MAASLRLLLTGLLSLAVALHGNAGAAMADCAPPTPASASLQDTDAHAAHHHGVDANAASHLAVDANLGDDTVEDDSVGADAKAAKSGACAACCIAALPGDAAPIAIAAGIDAFAPIATRVQPVFLTGGPERPPRRTGA